MRNGGTHKRERRNVQENRGGRGRGRNMEAEWKAFILVQRKHECSISLKNENPVKISLGQMILHSAITKHQ